MRSFWRSTIAGTLVLAFVLPLASSCLWLDCPMGAKVACHHQPSDGRVLQAPHCCSAAGVQQDQLPAARAATPDRSVIALAYGPAATTAYVAVAERVERVPLSLAAPSPPLSDYTPLRI